MKNSMTLPVPVLENPHWRVNIRPTEFISDTIPSLAECTRLVQKNAVRFRGWDYPHLSRQNGEIEYGKNWIASWANFAGHIEYWRLYQSSQFLDLFSVRESTRTDWRAVLQADTEAHLFHVTDVDWNTVPGFISIINAIYCISEIIEFATRMVQSDIYHGAIDVSIALNKVKGFVLTTSSQRILNNYYSATMDSLEHTWTITTESLLSDSTQCSLDILVWFFERFGWFEPPVEVFRKDIDECKAGRL